MSWLAGLWSSTDPGSSVELLTRPIYGGRYFIPAIAAVYLFLALATTEPRVRIAPFVVASALLLTGVVYDFTLVSRGMRAVVDLRRVRRARAASPCAVVIPPNWTVEIDP